MSLHQIKKYRNQKMRRMNQLPIGQLYIVPNEIENISEINRRDKVEEFIKEIIYEWIDKVENTHTFVYIHKNEAIITKPKNIFKKIIKKLFK